MTVRDYIVFQIEDEVGNYRLHLCGCAQGDAEDSFTYYHNADGQNQDHTQFSTKDRDNDYNAKENCAAQRMGYVLWHDGWDRGFQIIT